MRISAIAALAVLAAIAPAARAVEVDGVAAKVDSAVILKSDVRAELARAGLPPDKYGEVLGEMIERKLVLKAAKEAKMTMQDWVVENRVREITAKAFDGDRNRLTELLAKQKTTYAEWRQRISDDMVVSAMRWQTVDRNVSASPAAMREEFSKHPEKYMTGGVSTVSVILLKPEDSGLRDEVSAALKSQSFADVARKYSVDSHAADGGVWKDVVPEDVFRPEVCGELAEMPKGTISHWLDLDGWSFLLRKDDEVESRAQTFEEAYKAVEANVRDEAAAKRYGEWIERLKADAYIKVFD